MKDNTNHHELIPRGELEEILRVLEEENPMSATETKHGNSYHYGTSEDTPVSKERLLAAIKGAEIEDIYVHSPFCVARCHYCTYPIAVGQGQDKVLKFLDELAGEIQEALDFFGYSDLKSIHVGGGTPNYLELQELERFSKLIAQGFPLQNLRQMDIEVSPVNLDEEKIALLAGFGFNRISMGIQTFDDGINQRNGRFNQSAEQVIGLVEVLKRYFPNISVDLLAGQEGQSLHDLSDDFRKALDLDVNSIYLYQVRQAFRHGGLDEVEALNHFLSYFSQNGYEILSHNQVIKKRNSDGYCQQREGRAKLENLLGIGPAANSEMQGYIFTNVPPAEYLRSGRGINAQTIKMKQKRNQKALYLLRALRYFTRPDVDGLLVGDYQGKFGTHPYDDFKGKIDFMGKAGLLIMNDGKIEVTSKGMLFTQWIDNYLTRHYK